ncbi:hypothetical protein W822_12930 [Advenella kashmirensis W13003]|uniref:Uncharacterized protein n=1 Tax=Advenella kashmirensis W13003 TaxID=1424334 RepID=V8QRT0_9BURK|nr:hypothetical protein W822_12930 [Advenella kashmirensis W13003]
MGQFPAGLTHLTLLPLSGGHPIGLATLATGKNMPCYQ